MADVASDIELVVIWWLNNHKVSYQFQTSLAGGFYELGGAVVDFIIENNLAWRVMGEYWHRGVEKTGQDIMQKEMLSTEGYMVVDLWEDDLLERAEETLTKALQGQEMLR